MTQHQDSIRSPVQETMVNGATVSLWCSTKKRRTRTFARLCRHFSRCTWRSCRAVKDPFEGRTLWVDPFRDTFDWATMIKVQALRASMTSRRTHSSLPSLSRWSASFLTLMSQKFFSPISISVFRGHLALDWASKVTSTTFSTTSKCQIMESQSESICHRNSRISLQSTRLSNVLKSLNFHCWTFRCGRFSIFSVLNVSSNFSLAFFSKIKFFWSRRIFRNSQSLLSASLRFCFHLNGRTFMRQSCRQLCTTS